MTADLSPKPCQWCGMFHNAMCPRVSTIRYFENGMIQSVSFFPPVVLPPLPLKDDRARAQDGEI